MLRGQFIQARRQFEPGALEQPAIDLVTVDRRALVRHLNALPFLLDPLPLARNEAFSFPFRSPARQRHPHRTVLDDPDDVAARFRVTNEHQIADGRRIRERKAELRQWPPYTRKPRLRRLSASAISIATALAYGIGLRCA